MEPQDRHACGASQAMQAQNRSINDQQPLQSKYFMENFRQNPEKENIVRCYRHAQSESNAGGVSSDPALIPLSAEGHQQGNRSAANHSTPPDRIIHSPYLRTRQTAAPFIQKFQGVVVLECPIQEFTYLAPDRCLNTTSEQRLPLVREYWERNDPNYRDPHHEYPFVESFQMFSLRVSNFLDQARNWQGYTLMFSHELFMRRIIQIISNGETDPTPDTMRRFFEMKDSNLIPNLAFFDISFETVGTKITKYF